MLNFYLNNFELNIYNNHGQLKWWTGPHVFVDTRRRAAVEMMTSLVLRLLRHGRVDWLFDYDCIYDIRGCSIWYVWLGNSAPGTHRYPWLKISSELARWCLHWRLHLVANFVLTTNLIAHSWPIKLMEWYLSCFEVNMMWQPFWIALNPKLNQF